MNLQGKIKTIAPIVLRGTTEFKTRKIMLDRTTQYEGNLSVNHTEITLLGDRADLPEELNLQPGDIVTCDFQIKGRFFDHEGVEKFAQDINAWNVKVVGKVTQPAPEPTEASAEEMP